MGTFLFVSWVIKHNFNSRVVSLWDHYSEYQKY